MDRPECRLEALYFAIQSTQATLLMAWNGLSDECREQAQGTFDGSSAANCLSLLNDKIVARGAFQEGRSG
jgi:hypothetical protein